MDSPQLAVNSPQESPSVAESSLPMTDSLPTIAAAQTDDGTGKVAQMYQAPVLPEFPKAIPLSENITKPTEKTEDDLKGFAEVKEEFKAIHTVQKPPKMEEPVKKFDKPEKTELSDLNDKMLALFQFADNLPLTVEEKCENKEPQNPFQLSAIEKNDGLHPVLQKETLFELKPIVKRD
jgi:hypothetical protein